ncbi:MAG: 16S rRNA (cytosine(1402)-N(4))-methyltransferase RsmH [Phycisphaerae bacterium]|nr:16S rRNA (cytosine(1402)-N(4))-methyltransferase RsmH [Phycisphaerae bacterium]
MPDFSQGDAPNPDRPHRRRPRYRGTHPRHFDERYKEHQAETYPEIVDAVRARGATLAGTHVPVLLAEVMAALAPAEGDRIADATLGYGGHAAEFLKHIGPTGWLFGFDVDAAQLGRTQQRLAASFANISVHRSHFAGIGKILAANSLDGYDIVLADLGVSSMQVDDPTRGFSYKHDGLLDMRMDMRRSRTAADWLALLSAEELAKALAELADEPDHARIAEAIVARRDRRPIRRTSELVELIFRAKGLTRRMWREQTGRDPHALHPAAKTFQVLRILVNDELESLKGLLRIAPTCLRAGGRIGIISFHSGEDRLVERAFRDGVEQGLYAACSDEPITPGPRERFDNPRSRSARFRWARRS